MRFLALFIDFLIFSIFNGFGVVWLLIVTPWLDFLPGAAQIDLGWNFTCIQIFLFIWRSCADLELLESRCLCLSWSSRFACANIFR